MEANNVVGEDLEKKRDDPSRKKSRVMDVSCKDWFEWPDNIHLIDPTQLRKALMILNFDDDNEIRISCDELIMNFFFFVGWAQTHLS